MRKVNHRKFNINTETYVKNPERKKPRREGERFHYNNGYYYGVLWCVRVPGLN